MQDTLDYAALAERVFRPTLARLTEVRAAIAEITDAREAWETLSARGVLPEEWVDNDARWFRSGPPVLEEPLGRVRSDHEAGEQVIVWLLDEVTRYRLSSAGRLSQRYRAAEPLRAGDFVVRCGSFDVRPAEPAVWTAFPQTIESVTAFAADIVGASAAEALAREHFGDSNFVVHWCSINDEDELVAAREDALNLARSPATPPELRAVLALGYFARGLDRERGIELLCREHIEEA